MTAQLQPTFAEEKTQADVDAWIGYSDLET